MSTMTRQPSRAEIQAAEYRAARDLDFTEPEWEAIDRLEYALTRKKDLTPSSAGKAIGVNSQTALRFLQFLVANQSANFSGNGAWRHFHPGKAS